jgi:hypothetical protein
VVARHGRVEEEPVEEVGEIAPAATPGTDEEEK